MASARPIDTSDIEPGRLGLFSDYAALRAAKALASDYLTDGNDLAAHKHKLRALDIQASMIEAACNATGLTAAQLRDILDA